MQELKLSQFVIYDGHSIKANGGVSLRFTARYSELPKTLQLSQMLNLDVEILVKTDKVYKLGNFTLNSLSIDHDGESKIRFTSIKDFVEIDVLNSIVSPDEIKVQYKAVYDGEDDEGANENV